MAAADVDLLNRLLPWQHSCWRRMRDARRSGRLPHALLVCGREGLGKLHFAQLLGRSLLCRSPDPEGLPCGRCEACVLLRAETHPDLRLFQLEINERTNKEKSAITIDQVRGITDYLTLKSHYNGYKIVIIAPADRLNQQAANALLKTLEEPPADTLLVLVSARPAALPGTILSRCQRLVFAPVTPDRENRDDLEAAVAWIESRIGPDHDPALLLNLAGGAPLAAVRLAADSHAGFRKTALEDLRDLAAGRADPIRVADKWLKFGLQESLYWLYAGLADMVRLKATKEPPFMNNPDQREMLAAAAARLDARSLIVELDRVSNALRTSVDGQLNPQLLLEDTLLGWVSINTTSKKS